MFFYKDRLCIYIVKKFCSFFSKATVSSRSDTESSFLDQQEQLYRLEEEKANYSSLILELQDLLEERDSEISNFKVVS